MTYRDIDWNTVWKDLYEKNAECRGSGECASIWESREKALDFLNQSRENPERIQHIIDGLPLRAESAVLDIGAGPGTLAVPLAGRVARVTAVEPAAGMVEVMEEYAAEGGCIKPLDRAETLGGCRSGGRPEWSLRHCDGLVLARDAGYQNSDREDV